MTFRERFDLHKQLYNVIYADHNNSIFGQFSAMSAALERHAKVNILLVS